MPGQNILGNCYTCCICPPVTVECRTLEASKSKCGFTPYDGGTARYLTQTITFFRYDFTQNTASDCENESTGCFVNSSVGTTSITDTRGCISTIDPTTCAQTDTLTGSRVSLFTSVIDVEPPCEDENISSGSTILNASCGSGPVSPAVITTVSPTQKTASYSDSLFQDSHGDGDCYTSGEFNVSISYSQTLSDEYTTATLVAAAESALDGMDFDEEDLSDFNTCNPTATRNLSPDEFSITLSKAQYRFATTVPSRRYLRITWDVILTPEGGTPSVMDSLELELFPTDFAGKEIGDTYETGLYDLDTPEEDGTYSIANVVVSCRPHAEEGGG